MNLTGAQSQKIQEIYGNNGRRLTEVIETIDQSDFEFLDIREVRNGDMVLWSDMKIAPADRFHDTDYRPIRIVLKRKGEQMSKLNPTITVHLQDIYKCTEEVLLKKIPGEYEAVSFRIPGGRDIYLNPVNFLAREFDGQFADSPRVILARKPKKTIYGYLAWVSLESVYGESDVEIPAGYDFVRFSPNIHTGEHFLDPTTRKVFYCGIGHNRNSPVIILVKL